MRYIAVKNILTQRNQFATYQGCNHGCIYCDLRSDIYKNGDFENIIVKEDALNILEKELSKKKSRFMIHSSSLTDCYIPLEKELELTKGVLKLANKYAYGVSLFTKSNLILRDIDLLKEINAQKRVVVITSISTLNDSLCKTIEPNVSTARERFEMLKKFNEIGIDTVVHISPILPFITDTADNIKSILEECKKCGVKAIITTNLNLILRSNTREYFYDHLDSNFPKLRDKYMDEFEKTINYSTGKNKQLENIIFKFCLDNNIIYEKEKINEFLEYIPERENLFDFEF